MIEQAIVIKSTGSWYWVRNGNKVVQCKIKGKFRQDKALYTNPVVVGDHVDYEMETNDIVGVISKIHDRRNFIVRKSTNLSRQAHVIAANVDQAVLVVTLAFPQTYIIFVDRYLLTVESYSIKPIIVFNKVDLYNEPLIAQMQEWKSIYENIGYTCIETSVAQNLNLDLLYNTLANKVSVISGISGVGKSSIINALVPDLNLKTGIISDYHLKGKHTTTFSEMFELPNGGAIIDTPGIKAFGIIDVKEDKQLSHYFPEMFALSGNCQYYNCSHTHEPNCAVKKGVAEGTVSESRYNSYLAILFDENDKYRK